MFDVGFLELLMIGLVGLIVIGPERLPRVARTAGRWVGRARRAVSSVKAEIDRELRAEELKEILRKQGNSEALERILESPSAKSDQASPDSSKGASPSAESGPPDRGDAP